MSETRVSTETPIKLRLLELYMITCQQVSSIKSLLLSKDFREAGYMFQEFRINMTEMYYLARTITDIKDDVLMKSFKKWTTVKCGKKPTMRFYSSSIRLFEEFSELLVTRGGIV